MIDTDTIDELPEKYALAARARISGMDRYRLAVSNIENEDTDTETDQQLDGDTVTLRGLSDEALEYVTTTYDVEVVD